MRHLHPPSGRKEKLFIAHQGLRPWQRSCALRAETQVVHCPPPGGNRSYSLSSRDCVPGNIRPPSGRNLTMPLKLMPFAIVRNYGHSGSSGRNDFWPKTSCGRVRERVFAGARARRILAGRHCLKQWHRAGRDSRRSACETDSRTSGTASNAPQQIRLRLSSITAHECRIRVASSLHSNLLFNRRV